VLRSEALDRRAGAELFFKAENLQLTGSFKVRGALHRVSTFSSEEIAPGLITVSAGNAALGAAYAAREMGAQLVVVMPENAVAEKLAAVTEMGATVERNGVTNATQAFARLAELQQRHGYTLVHPFDDPFVITGAGTATLELLEEVPDLEDLVVPASGGGLAAGALLAVQAVAPGVRVHLIQPEGAAGIALSLRAGSPMAPERIETVADGLTAPRPGRLNFALFKAAGLEVQTVSDDQILAAMGEVIRRLRVIVEPAAAAAFAGVLALPGLRGRRTGVLLSGGNASASRLVEVLSRV
jgi:threonine dehydratase